jgi:hypothetical protein
LAKKFTWPLGVFARQQLTLKGTTKENWAELARAARSGGDIADAAEFAAKAGDEALLHELEREAVESGDLFNYQSVRRVRGLEAEPEKIRAIAAAAKASGHDHFAQKAIALLPTSEESAAAG